MKLCIVGYGPSGALLALRLARAHPTYHIDVLERNSASTTDDREQQAFHGAHLSHTAIAQLQECRVWQHIDARTQYHVCYEIAGHRDVALPNENAAQPMLQDALVPQCFVQEALERAVRACANVSVKYQVDVHTVLLERTGVRVNDEWLYDAVFACDGASSGVRKSLGVAFPGCSGRRWCVTDVHCAAIGDEVRDMVWAINETRAGMYVSLFRNHWRLEHHVREHESAHCSLALALQRCAHFVPPQMAQTILKRGKHLRSSVYRMHDRMADTFQVAAAAGDAAVYLVGDAAHLTEPFTGQGISNGFDDVKYIVEHFPGRMQQYTAQRKQALKWQHRKARWIGHLLHINSTILLTLAHVLFQWRLIPNCLVQRIADFFLNKQ